MPDDYTLIMRSSAVYEQSAAAVGFYDELHKPKIEGRKKKATQHTALGLVRLSGMLVGSVVLLLLPIMRTNKTRNTFTQKHTAPSRAIEPLCFRG